MPAPFTVEHVQIRNIGGGESSFTPAARIYMDVASLRGGLLPALSDENVRTLLATIACVTANGRVETTPHRIADLLGVDARRARERLTRLSSVRYEREPVMRLRQTESGLEMFSLSPHVLASRDAIQDEVQVPVGSSGGGDAPALSRREVVIAHSRAAHAKPRAEVEREVLAQLGLQEPEVFDASPEGDLRRRLAGIGMAREMATALIEEFGRDAVTRQLHWLPHRRAKDPARYLAAAVRGNYAEPHGAFQARSGSESPSPAESP